MRACGGRGAGSRLGVPILSVEFEKCFVAYIFVAKNGLWRLSLMLCSCCRSHVVLILISCRVNRVPWRLSNLEALISEC